MKSEESEMGEVIVITDEQQVEHTKLPRHLPEPQLQVVPVEPKVVPRRRIVPRVLPN
jgi:hypothetical protein